jgi:hypothetical protein
MWVAKYMANKSQDVTLIAARGSSRGGELAGGRLPSNLEVVETIEPSWEGRAAEEKHYLMYKELLEKKYGSGDGIVWDNTWHCFSYLSAKKFPKMIGKESGLNSYNFPGISDYQGFMLNICHRCLTFLLDMYIMEFLSL